jgi:SAM-dependent methyltransferase
MADAVTTPYVRPGWLARLKRIGIQSLRMDPIRKRVAYVRFMYYVKLRKRLRTFDANNDGITENTISHNVRGMADLTVVRSNMLIRPLSVIQSLNENSRILSIGPRTEGEIFNLMAHGFSPDKIRGLDLISYSPWIDVGNMHEMPYPDSSWDAVIMGWVISYSNEQKRAAMEVVRVTRPGGIVAVGLEWNPPGTRDKVINQLGYVLGHTAAPQSTDDVLALFGDHVDRVYVRHDPVEHGDKNGEIFVIFSIKKP